MKTASHTVAPRVAPRPAEVRRLAAPTQTLLGETPAKYLRTLGLGLRHHRPERPGSAAGLATAAAVINSFELASRSVPKAYRRRDWGMFVRYATPEAVAPPRSKDLDLDGFARVLAEAGVRTRTVRGPGVEQARRDIAHATQDPSMRVVACTGKPGCSYAPILGYRPADYPTREAVLIQRSLAGRPTTEWVPLDRLCADMTGGGYVIARRPPQADLRASFQPTSTPAALISLESDEGIELLLGATKKSMTRLGGLIACHEIQETLSFCGLASLTMAANDLQLSVEPLTQGAILAGLSAQRSAAVIEGGATLNELGQIAGALGASVEVHHADQRMDVDSFRARCIAALEAEDRHVIASYDRQSLGQDGGGHFSPLAAYNRERDMFLVYDVAPWKAAPYWVSTADLHRSMTGVDRTKCRGIAIVSR